MDKLHALITIWFDTQLLVYQSYHWWLCRAVVRANLRAQNPISNSQPPHFLNRKEIFSEKVNNRNMSDMYRF